MSFFFQHRKGLFWAIAVVTGFFSAFAFGVHAGVYKTFPFSYIHSAKHLFLSSTGIRWDVFADTSGRRQVPCPANSAVILAIGQSNAANDLPSFGEQSASDAAVNFFDGKCYAIEDPVLGATGNRGSLWSQFAQELSASLHGLPVVMITSAIDGSTVRQWLMPPAVYVARAERQLSMAKEMGLKPIIVIWFQGEADAVEGTSQSQYEQDLRDLISRLRGRGAGAGQSWLIFQASRCTTKPSGSEEIRLAQASVARTVENVYVVMNTDQLGSRFRYDDCHFNDNGKARIIARLLPLVQEQIKRRASQ
jgi:Carbohydrate esterase, sialic acid-specific acetylesterase